VSNLNRRLRFDLASLLLAVADSAAAGLAAATSPATDMPDIPDGARFAWTGLDLTLPVRCEVLGGLAFRVRLAAVSPPAGTHPGTLTLRAEPLSEV